MKLARLYKAVTRESAPPGADLDRELAKENSRRRKAVSMRAQGASWRDIGHKLAISHGSAASLVQATIQALRKRLLNLPRYHSIGHPGPPAATRFIPKAKPKRGRPPLPRCACGRMTVRLAKQRKHHCG